MKTKSTLVLCFVSLFSFAQVTNPFAKFGKVTAEHLQKKIYSIDSNANAVVLCDIGNTAIEGNSKNWFSITFTRHRVVHILNSGGYDAADIEIPLYSNGPDEEKLTGIKAVTYNLEQGKVVETRLEKSGIFKEVATKKTTLIKFTMPNVREGSIIEFEYTVKSDWIDNLDPWNFQEDMPVLWSEYKLSVPQFFTYAFLSRGYHSMYINERKDRQSTFVVLDTRSAGAASDRITFIAGVTDWRWVMINLPAMREENYSSALKNHISSIEFQLASYNYPLTPKDLRSTWPGLVKDLLKSDYFGADLNRSNNWMNDELKPLLSGKGDSLDKAKKIFEYVRDNFTCTSYNDLTMTQPLKSVYRAKKGNVAEVNLVLTAMLRNANFNADPVILSTSDHGYALDVYPMITSFNYVVSKLNINGSDYYLDATHPRLAFGKLLPECYNGHARVVNETATAVRLSADSLLEKKVTNIFISNDHSGKWIGSYHSSPGYYESYSIRQKIRQIGIDEYFSGQAKEFNENIRIVKPHIDSLENYNEPIAVHFDLDLNPEKSDVLYINPLFNRAWKKNPFSPAERYYPVEMPYTIDEIYLLSMEVPQGYVVDELPKQFVAKLDEQGHGLFEYLISYSGSTISMKCRLKLTKTVFMPDEYETLREFFNLVVTKENEQIVFKKKKA